jgi:hypothetical protein
MFQISLKPGERLDGKSNKFTVMADATRKKRSASGK